MFSDFTPVLCYFECINTRRSISVVRAVYTYCVSTLQWLMGSSNGRKCYVEVEMLLRQMELRW